MVNLGTPKSFKKRHIIAYLFEFFSDKRMITRSFVRYIVRLLVPILRAKKLSKKYQSIWFNLDNDNNNKPISISPLLFYTHNLAKNLQKSLDLKTSQYTVKYAMNYGSPNIKVIIDQFCKNNITKIIVIPMFPQYASCTVGSILSKIYLHAAQKLYTPMFFIVSDLYQCKKFANIQAQKIKTSIKNLDLDHNFHLILSYHSIPLEDCQSITAKKLYSSNANCNNELNKLNNTSNCGSNNFRCCKKQTIYNLNCYRRQCIVHSQLIANELGLDNQQFTSTFQSKIGPQKWIGPSTTDTLKKLCTSSPCQTKHPKLEQKKPTTIVISTPGFISDCLETLEEIAIEAKNLVNRLDPKINFIIVPCVNDHPMLSDYFAARILNSSI